MKKYRILPFLVVILALFLTGAKRPNVVILTASNLGFSDLGCFGSEIATPVLDNLAANGMVLTQFYTCGESSRTQTALMLGQHPQRVGMGIPMTDLKWPSYRGSINDSAATLGEFFHSEGYHTLAVGKWSFAKDYEFTKHRFAWAHNRGFDSFYGTVLTQTSYFEPKNLMRNRSKFKSGANYYYTTAIADEAVRFLESVEKSSQPFFLYVAFTAPAWPLHALPEDIQRYRSRYVRGWDSIREDRFQTMKSKNMVLSRTELSPRDTRVADWAQLGKYTEWHAARMEVYAAQVSALDRSIGTILNQVKKMGMDDETLIVFLSDAGANAEELSQTAGEQSPFVSTEIGDGTPIAVGNNPQAMPGTSATFQSYGVPWANVSNTPFRGYAKTLYEGGLRAPCIISWGKHIAVGKVSTPVHVLDIYPTLVAATDHTYPDMIRGKTVLKPVGRKFMDLFLLDTRLEATMGESRKNYDRYFFWECDGHQAVRYGKWKLIRSRGSEQWELYNLLVDPIEQNDVYAKFQNEPAVNEMKRRLERWKSANRIYDWEAVKAQYIQIQKEEAERRERDR